MLNWGILGPGSIAHAFAGGIKASKTGRLVATGSRSTERSAEFAGKWGGVGCSYDEVLSNPDVEAVYISLPHHLHAEWTKKCARAGKAILCEKPFTLDHASAADALSVVKEEGVFFMEAFMYRCCAQTRKLVELLNQGAIGDPKVVACSFGFNVGEDWQNFRLDSDLGGGALMDVGTYCVSFQRLVFGTEPIEVEYRSKLTNGYDAYATGQLSFPNECLGTFTTAVHLQMKNDARIYGDKGMITVENPWGSTPGTKLIFEQAGAEAEELDLSCTGEQLYANEVDAVADFLDAKECPYMSINDTLGNMKVLDMLRASSAEYHARN
jgi:predicted dehydrogenase